MDAITYDSDKYGKVTGNFVRNNRFSTVNGYKQVLNRSCDETIFKNSVSFLDNIEIINASSVSERLAILQVFEKHGIKKLPDGRKVRDIVLVQGRKVN